MINAPFPFFVWAGGKRRLIKQLSENYPAELLNGQINNYIEPFVGGGAVFFDIMQKYNVKNATLIDINHYIINTYTQVRDNPDNLISILSELEHKYNSFTALEEKEIMYYDIRQNFNTCEKLDLYQAAYFIFLCRAFFNGVFRVNSKGKLNTPFGKKDKMKIYSKENIQACSELLQNTNLICGDYKKCERLITEHTFLYFDPPYRPTEKSGYLKYTAKPFSDVEQIHLSDFYRLSSDMGALIMLNNSFSGDGFLETLYKGFNFKQLHTHSMISGDPAYRKRRTELLITNY